MVVARIIRSSNPKYSQASISARHANAQSTRCGFQVASVAPSTSRKLVTFANLYSPSMSGLSCLLLPGTVPDQMLCDEMLDKIEKLVCENLNEDVLSSKVDFATCHVKNH
jgi:hypothetical protein